MKLVVDTYTTWNSVVTGLGAADVFYTAIGTEVTGAVGIYLTDDTAVVVGGAGNNIGVTTAAFTAAYASAVLVSTLPSVVV